MRTNKFIMQYIDNLVIMLHKHFMDTQVDFDEEAQESIINMSKSFLHNMIKKFALDDIGMSKTDLDIMLNSFDREFKLFLKKHLKYES